MPVWTRIRKMLALLCCGGILLSVQCPPLVVDSLKVGTMEWLSGSMNSFNVSQLSDLILAGFIGGNGNTGT